MLRVFKIFVATIALSASAGLAHSHKHDEPVTFATDNDPRHLVVLNKRGTNFELVRENRDKMLEHRQIYLDLTASGHIVASGLLRSEPPVGFVLFREGVDEEEIRARLEDDWAIREGVIELEFLYWDIQMGGIPTKLEQ